MPRKGSSADRGYDWPYVQERRAWKPRVAAGQVCCWRCRNLIQPGTPWDLGHDDHNRDIIHGPEHTHCNRSAGATHGNRLRKQRRHPHHGPTSPPAASRDW